MSFWSFFGYSDETCAYTVSGTFQKDVDDIFHQHTIKIEYPNFHYCLKMNIKKIDLDLDILFINFFIKQLNLLINNKIEDMIMLGTTYCKITHINGEYRLGNSEDTKDDWFVKFDDNFGKKLLDVLQNLFAKLEEIKKIIQKE